MKPKLALSKSKVWILLLLFVPTTLLAQFIHPGMLHTQNDFDRIKRQLKEGNPSVKAGYKKLLDNWMANKWDGQWGPTENIVRGSGDGMAENYMQATYDASMAYLFALRYKITDSTKYAQRAVGILNSYPPVTKQVTGDPNTALASGFIGYYFANAAELLRDYEGWKEKDLNAFRQWMIDVFFSTAYNFLRTHYGTCNTLIHSNWGASNALTVISIGILCDDPTIYNEGMWYLKQGPFNESLNPELCGNGGGFIPYYYKDERGPYGYLNQMQESNRDQPHCMGALGMLLCAAETAWNQGDNLWNINNNMIAGGIEYVAAWNSYDTKADADALANFPTTPWQGCNEYHASISWNGRGGMRPIWQIGINHFSNRLGKEMTFARKAKALTGVEGGPGDYGPNSGGYDNIGFGDLMYNEEPASKYPTILQPRITYKDKIINFAEISKVDKGSTLTLQASTPEGEENGTWEWDNGETTAIRHIQADHSALYRVTFTNAQGVKSRQLFSVAVYGDCARSTVTPTIQCNGNTINDTIVTIPKGSSAVLSATPKAWDYDSNIRWTTGETSTSIQVNNIRSERIYSVTITNRNGGITKYNFHINLTEITPYMQSNGVTSGGSYALVPEGQNIKLWAIPVASSTGGTFRWNDGFTGDTLKLNNIQEGGTFTVTYTSAAGKESKASWQIDVFNKNKLKEGEYYFQNAATGLYYTNPTKDYSTDNSEIMTFEPLQKENLDAQIWKFTLDVSSNRYKITSKKDGRFLNEHGVIRNRDYYPTWNSYNIYGLTGVNTYAFQNGGDAGTEYWIINSQEGITGKGTTTMQSFPFKLFPADGTGIETIETKPIDYWQNEITGEIHFTTTQGILYLYKTDGTPVLQYPCKDGYNILPIDHLKPGLYVGIIETPYRKMSIKIRKR